MGNYLIIVGTLRNVRPMGKTKEFLVIIPRAFEIILRTKIKSNQIIKKSNEKNIQTLIMIKLLTLSIIFEILHWEDVYLVFTYFDSFSSK